MRSRSYTETMRALELLSQFNAKQDWFTQKIHPPAAEKHSVPTLDGGEMPMTPMLQARFDFCGRWEKAYLCQDWLSPEAMASRPRSRAMRKRILNRAKFWPDSILARSIDRPGAVALFGTDDEELDEIYLIRSARRGQEPAIVYFSGQEERAFPSLLALLQHALSAGEPHR